MGMTNPRRLSILAVLALLLASTWSLSAQAPSFFSRLGSPRDLSLGSVGILIVNNDPGTDTSAIHLTGGIAASASYPLGDSPAFDLRPNVVLWRSWYYWTAAGKAVPVGVEDRDVWLLGLLIDLPLTFHTPLGKAMEFSAGLGLCLNLRVGFKADAAESDATVAKINTYLWSSARFIMPTTSVGLSLKINDKLSGNLGIKAYWPVYNLWAGEGLGFLDQTMATLSLSIGWHPGS